MQNTERVAWGVLLVAFAVFCIGCALSTLLAHFFVFQSTTALIAEVQPSRGAIGLTGADQRELVVRVPETLLPGNVVRPSEPQSQAVIEIRDPYNDDRIIALLFLKGETSVATFGTALRPRFNWGTTGYQITLSNVSGEVEVWITNDLPHSIDLTLTTSRRISARFSGQGRYTLIANDSEVVLDNHNGHDAIMIVSQLSSGRSIPAGARGNYPIDAPAIIVQQIPLVDLISNTYFEETSQFGGSIPLFWSCWNDPNVSPTGNYNLVQQDSSTVMQLVRGDNASSHGATLCRQGNQIDDDETPWRDVTDYDYLSLRTTFYIQYQSLSLCGQAASECPMMLRLHYLNRDGNPMTLDYGFFVMQNSGLEGGTPYPRLCPTCVQEHIQIREQVWFTYDTGNILATLPIERRPAQILYVQFLASGHQYDLRINDVALLAGNLETGVARLSP